MIPIIYDKDEIAFVSNGLGRLSDCISCIVTEERNGIYECDFEYPMDGANFDLIIPGRTISVTHDDTGDVQPFDIVSYSKPIDGIVTFHAVHISYRLSGKLMQVMGQTVNDLTTAISMLNAGRYDFSFDADFTSSGYCSSFGEVPKSVRQVLGGSEGSLLDVYGGEYKWDKWNVHLYKSRGSQRDFTIRYGVNMVDYTEDVDYSGTFNKAMPYWEGEGSVIVGNTVDSGSDTYTGRDIAVPMDLTDKFENKPTRAQLEAKALSIMNREKTHLPSQNITVDFIRLQDSPEYEQFSRLLACELCDSIYVVFPGYDTSGSFKIVKTEWDVLTSRYNKMELGHLSTSLAEALGITTTPDNLNSITDLTVSGDLTVAGNITQGGESVASKSTLAFDHHLIRTFTSVSNSYTETFNNISKSGYYPLGIVGHEFTGTNKAYMAVGTLTLQNITDGSCSVSYTIRNTGSSAWAGDFYTDILWVKL